MGDEAMYVVTFGLLKGRNYDAIIEKEWVEFCRCPSHQALFQAVETVRSFKNRQDSFPVMCEMVKDKLKTAVEDEGIVYVIGKIDALQRNHPEAITRELQMEVLHIVKQERQMRWLSWLEDFTCSQIRNIMRIRPSNPQAEVIYIVTFSEFYFTDYNDNKNHVEIGETVTGYVKPFYRPVMEAFVNGRLPDAQRNSIRESYRLAGLTGENNNLIIFAGTIIWKPLSDASGYFYNTAPIFYHGALQLLYDKREVSGVDGVAGCKEKHKHEPLPSSHTSLDNISSARSACSPVFEWEIHGRKLKFALSICKDYTTHRIREDGVDIHVLISAGMFMHEDCIWARHLFIQCEREQAHEGYLIKLDKNDREIWRNKRGSEAEKEEEWEGLDTSHLGEKYAVSTYQMDEETGVMVCHPIVDVI